MFVRATTRKKDGKVHRYWSVVENRRLRDQRIVQRTVLYLGEINDSQKSSWQKSLSVFDEEKEDVRQINLFAEDSKNTDINDIHAVKVKLNEMQLKRPRSFGGCWLGCVLWDQLKLTEFWDQVIPAGREAVRWSKVLELLVVNRLIEPGSEWSIHRDWFDRSAMDELLGEDYVLAEKNRLYRCLDHLIGHKESLFTHLTNRWRDMFNASYEVLLYDLTSTYFEGEMDKVPKAVHGYSRDHRPDCRQVVIALVLTPQGFPIAYEVMAGNTSDKTTLKDFLEKIAKTYGRIERVWLMDRGIPTEEVLSQMRSSDPKVFYIVGTPRGRLSKYEKAFLNLPWEKARNSVQIKLLQEDAELYVLARSTGRLAKERSMRRRKLKRLWITCKKIQNQNITRNDLLLKLGAAKKEAGRAFRLVKIDLPREGEGVKEFRFSLDKSRLRKARRREGQYLLRSNLVGKDPAIVWERYIQLVQIEEAFKGLKSDLAIRPIYHQLAHRVEAHILVAFLGYCLIITLKQQLKVHASGLTPRAVLEKLSTIQMMDVYFPTTDGRWLIMPRYTQPEKEHLLLLEKLNLNLPTQPPPRITASGGLLPT